MRNIADKVMVLKLNKGWRPVGQATVGKSLFDLVAGVVHAMDIEYDLDDNGAPIIGKALNMRPVKWEEWVTLPVRPYDMSIRSTKMEIRIPTIVIAKNYNKMPKKKFKKTPSNGDVRFRDGNRCQYTGRILADDEGSVDHIVPLSRGGTNTWENVAWAAKEINAQKGNKLNSECGLKVLKKPEKPADVEVWRLIRRAMHPDWKIFLMESPVVERLFLDAHQHRMLHYEAAGKIYRIDFSARNAEEMADAVAGRRN